MYPSIDFSWSLRHSKCFSIESVSVQGTFAVQFGEHLRLCTAEQNGRGQGAQIPRLPRGFPVFHI